MCRAVVAPAAPSEPQAPPSWPDMWAEERATALETVNLSCDIVEVDKLNQDADVDFYLGD